MQGARCKVRGKGFTLLEMLIVIIIIMLLAGLSVSLLNIFTKGQAVRKSADIVEGAINLAAQYSHATHVMHFLVLENKPEGIEINIYKDKNDNKQYDSGTDEKIRGDAILSAKNVRFKKFPAWIGLKHLRGMTFPSGYAIVEAGDFETAIAGNAESGEIILEMQSQTSYKMCMDLDDITGEVRKSYFLVQ